MTERTSSRGTIKLLVELALFALSTGVAAYLSETHSWTKFVYVTVVSMLLVVAVWLLESKPLRDHLRRLEERRFSVVHRMDRAGFSEFYDMLDPAQQDKRNADTRKVIQTAHSMYLAANSGASYLDPAIERHWPAVKVRLDAGTPFNVLLLDPFSGEKRRRDSISQGGEHLDSKFRFETLCSMYDHYPNVQIRFVDGQMYGTVFATESMCFFDPYHLGTIGQRITNRFLCLAFSRKEDGQASQYSVLKQHFDNLWNLSVDFEDYFLKNRARIQQHSPAACISRRRHGQRP